MVDVVVGGGSVVVDVEVVVGGSVVVDVEVVVGGRVVVVGTWSSRRQRRGRGRRRGQRRGRGRRRHRPRCARRDLLAWDGAGSGEEEPSCAGQHVELGERTAGGVGRRVDRERRRATDLGQRGGIDGAGRLGIEGVLRATEGQRLCDRGGAAIVAHHDEAEQAGIGSEEQLGERLAGADIRVDRLSAAVTHLLKRIRRQIGLRPGERVGGATGIDGVIVRGVGRAGDVGRRPDGLGQISRQLVLAAIRHRQIDGRVRRLLGSRVGDGRLFLGDPHEVLTAEWNDPIELEASIADTDFVWEPVGLTAIAQILHKIDSLSAVLSRRRTRRTRRGDRPDRREQTRRGPRQQPAGDHADHSDVERTCWRRHGRFCYPVRPWPDIERPKQASKAPPRGYGGADVRASSPGPRGRGRG